MLELGHPIDKHLSSPINMTEHCTRRVITGETQSSLSRFLHSDDNASSDLTTILPQLELNILGRKTTIPIIHITHLTSRGSIPTESEPHQYKKGGPEVVQHNGANKELIPLTAHDGIQAVTGRDLHTFLEVTTRYNDWITRLIEKYGFIEGQDYVLKNEYVPGGNGRQYEQSNHILTMDMAKEISMVQNNSQGRQARQYFIECERRAKEAAPSLPQDYASALRELAATVEAREIAEKRAAEQEAIATRNAKRLELAAPKVAKADAHTAATEWKGRQEFAREVQHWGRQWGHNINQESVYELLRRKGMLVSGNRRDRNHATAQAEKAGWATTAKGVSETTGKPWAAARISPRGQDVAWKWITKAIEQYGPQLNPGKEAA